MSTPATTFQRIISDRHFLGKLVTATVIAAAAALLLIVLILCVAGIAQLVIQAPDQDGLRAATLKSTGYPIGLIGEFVTWLPPLHSSAGALAFLSIVLCGVILLRTMLRNVVQRNINRKVAGSVSRLREHIQRQALRSNPGDLTGLQRDTAANLFQKTALQLETSARQWGFGRLTAACDLVVLVFLLLSVQWRVGIECIIPVFICWYVARVESERFEASAHLLTEQVDRGLQRLTQDLEKSRIVAGYGMEQIEHESFSNRLEQYRSRCAQLFRQRRQGRWTSLLIRMAAVALPGFILCRHVMFGSLLALPAAVALGTIIGLILITLLRIQDLPGHHSTGTVAAEDINQFLLRVPNVSQVVGARFLEPMSRLLQFDQVSVDTDNHAELLAGLDLKIEFGQRVALLSLNPLECQALVNLVPRFHDPASGQVLIDGVDIHHATLESLRAEAVIVGGDEPLFNTTILANITAGQKDISRQDAIEACKLVHAENFIRQLPKGYETDLNDYHIDEPGQKFRLSLARAIARNPALLIIQEPNVVMDSETKAMLDDTYQRICHGRTVIFLPTRLSTVKKCDRIVMLHHGRVAVDGRHDELVKSSELYRHWEYVHFNVFRNDD